MDPVFLELLVCPVTKQPLRLNEAELVSEEGEWIYPIRNGIPILLESEAIQIAKSLRA